MHSIFSRLWHPLIPSRTFLTAVLLAWSVLAFGGEIHDATVNGDLEKVKALLKDNPSLVTSKDDSGRTPLHRAALIGHKGVVELLLANKTEVNAKDNYGRTALDIAAIGGYTDVVGLLRQYGGQDGKTASLTAMAKPATTNTLATVTTKSTTTNVLATVTAKPVTTTDSTIHDAAKSGDSKKAKASRKGNPDAAIGTNNYGRMPLHQPKYRDATELLREHGDDE